MYVAIWGDAVKIRVAEARQRGEWGWKFSSVPLKPVPQIPRSPLSHTIGVAERVSYKLRPWPVVLPKKPLLYASSFELLTFNSGLSEVRRAQ